MNREQRRAKAKEDRKERKRMWPSAFIDIPAGHGLKDGDLFTISGLKRNKDGSIIRNCPEGQETTFIARIHD